ncbi:hypothetical protein ACVWXP_001965 [Bradyrhizobium sp. USDA 4463]
MTYVSKAALASCAFVCATLFSIGNTEQGTLSLSIGSAQARVGNPLTPMSVAGVARRHHRRAVYGNGYGAGVAGAAAVGTAAALGTAAAAAASPTNWGWGNNTWGNNTWGNAYAAQTDPHFGQPLYPHRAYYGHSPYYGYTGWDDYSTRNQLKCHPGGTIKLDDGQMYYCQ